MEGCDRKCATAEKRRRHLIDKHMYPKNFFFAITRSGIDGRLSLLNDGGHRHRRKSSISTKKEALRKSAAATADGLEEEYVSREMKAAASGKDLASDTDPKAAPDVDMDDLAGAMSALNFVPPSVRFGRGGGRTGFSRR